MFPESILDSQTFAICPTYTIEMNRTFIFREYTEPTAKSSPSYRVFQLAEDLKEQYTKAYPDVERVYTSQVISSKDVEK